MATEHALCIYIVDDQGIKNWAYFLEFPPGRAASHSLQELRHALDQA